MPRPISSEAFTRELKPSNEVPKDSVRSLEPETVQCQVCRYKRSHPKDCPFLGTDVDVAGVEFRDYARDDQVLHPPGRRVRIW